MGILIQVFVMKIYAQRGLSGQIILNAQNRVVLEKKLELESAKTEVIASETIQKHT